MISFGNYHVYNKPETESESYSDAIYCGRCMQQCYIFEKPYLDIWVKCIGRKIDAHGKHTYTHAAIAAYNFPKINIKQNHFSSATKSSLNHFTAGHTNKIAREFALVKNQFKFHSRTRIKKPTGFSMFRHLQAIALALCRTHTLAWPTLMPFTYTRSASMNISSAKFLPLNSSKMLDFVHLRARLLSHCSR